jgi:hypothetical protein
MVVQCYFLPSADLFSKSLQRCRVDHVDVRIHAFCQIRLLNVRRVGENGLKELGTESDALYEYFIHVVVADFFRAILAICDQTVPLFVNFEVYP